ncbi:MAG: hypothetical protein M3294_04285 [Pseudomonadota bacterium]|nr:hypothetical protein [Pseudomonadota bacterium]
MLKKSIQRRHAFIRRLRFIEIPTALPQLRFGFAGQTSPVLEGEWRFKAVRRNLAYATELRQRVLLLAFLAIHGNPYDVTSYQSQHPC